MKFKDIEDCQKKMQQAQVEALKILNAKIAEGRTARSFAQEFGCSEQFLSDIRKGLRPFPKNLLQKLLG